MNPPLPELTAPSLDGRPASGAVWPIRAESSGVAPATPAAAFDGRAARLRSRIEGFPRVARLWLAAGAAVACWACSGRPTGVALLLALWSLVALLRVPQRRLLWEQWAVVAASLALAHGLVVGGLAGLVGLGLLHVAVLRGRPEVATQPLVGFDLCQLLLTTAIRPSTTHHFLELTRPLDRQRLVEALAWLCGDVARLRSFVREAPLGVERFVAPRLWVDPATLLEWRETVVDPADVGWFERQLDVATTPAVRLFHAPRAGGGYLFGLTLHHSIADGTGAMALLDGLLRRHDRLRGLDVALPPIVSDGPRCRRLVWRHGWRAVLAMLVGSLRSPRGVRSASLLDDETPRPARFARRVLDVPVELWRAVAATAAHLGCTLSQLLIAASLRAADEVRVARGKMDATFRLLVPSDLRTLFQLPPSLPNYIGTVRVEAAAAEVRSPSLPSLIAARIRAGRQPGEQLRFQVQLGLLGLLPPALGRRFLHRFDQDPGTFAFSYLFSHIRVPTQLHLPSGTEVERLWCASTQGRQPSFGVVVTTIGERTSALLQYLEPYVARETARAFERALLRSLRALTDEPRRGAATCESA